MSEAITLPGADADPARPQGGSSTYRRIGLICNPRSHANRVGQHGLRNAAARYPDLAFDEPASLAALVETLRRFAHSGVELVVVSGGDGTLRDLLTALPSAYPESWPDIAILAAGNTNLAARVLGSPGTGPEALARLLDAAATGRLRRQVCRYLEIGWVGQPERAPIRGLFFGAAAFADGKRIADAEIHRRNLHKGIAVALTAALMVLRVVFGDRDRLKRGTPMLITLDDGPAREGDRFLVLATTLDRFMLGMWPFWEAGTGPIRWLDVAAPPRKFIAAVLAMALQRPRPWMNAAGYRSGTASHIRIRLDKPFVLDGEFFEAGPEGILLSAPGRVTVVAP